jgi:hypothetical protein
MLKQLGRDDRMRLMKFICSFAWADLEVRDAERDFVRKMVRKLDLGADDVRQVEQWLELPPKPEELDPNEIPMVHRKLFIDAARATVMADGEVDEEEAVNLALFEQLMRPSDED